MTKKYQFVTSVVRQLNTIKAAVDRRAREIREVFDNADETTRFYKGEQMRHVMQETKRIDAKLTSKAEKIINESTKVFDEQTELIRRNITYIILSYIVAIVFSFIAFYLATSLASSPTVNLLIWFSLITTVLFAVITSYFYTGTTEISHNFSNFVFTKTIENVKELPEMSSEA